MSDGAASSSGPVESGQMLEEEPDTPNTTAPSPPRRWRFSLSYPELIADWPLVVVGVCTLLIVVCSAVVVHLHASVDFDFGDLRKGFNTRGTIIGQRRVTVENINNKGNPWNDIAEQDKSTSFSWSEDGRRWQEGVSQKGLVCGGLGHSYSRLVFTSVEGENMWNTRAMKSMCSFDETWVSSHRDYQSQCIENTHGSCCPSWTLGNSIADLNNRSSCQSITEKDVDNTLTTLRSCAPFYRNGTLTHSCWDDESRKSSCSSVPDVCFKYNAVYQILHFLVDKHFLMSLREDVPPAPLRYSMLFLPIGIMEPMKNIYLDNLENRDLSDGITTVTGMEFYLTTPLFMHYVLKDAVYLGIAVAIVLLVLCVYTRSMCITFMTMITIFSSFTVSYFLYRVVFSVNFFPFLNLITLIVLLGIGADDAFVLCDAWICAKNDRPDSRLSERVSVTLRHAALSMFVTSFTTAAAFYTNLMSDITAMRCFGVFAGTAILVNYVLMVTWMPAVVVLHERYLRNLFTCVGAPHCQSFACWTKLSRAVDRVSEASRLFFEKALPVAVIKLRFLWLLFFLALMLGGVCVVFVNPKMKLPSRELNNIKMLHSSHPFERYSAEYKNLFKFEFDQESEPLRIKIIWGFLPIDNGDPLDPENKGTLTPDTTFDINSTDSKRWLSNFCLKLQNQSFVALNQDCNTVPDNKGVLQLTFSSTYLYSRANEKMHQFYSEVEAWILEQLRDAPQGLRNGWFQSDLDFYDLQNSLLDGTMIGMGMSVGLAFGVMILTTRNIIISLYAMISIAGTMFVTVGALVLLGWELNLIESLAISVAVGLSVDFTVHYAVAYCLAPGPERDGKVVSSLSGMGLAITMAALTTFATGAMMVPCTIVPFTLMGTFLMLIMCVSWAFATFFFQSLCRCLGPQGTFGQIPLPTKLQCFSSH